MMLNMETTLAERLKIALDESGLRKTDLYKRAGVSSGAVTQWLDGTTKSLKGKNLFKVADVLRVNPKWISGESQEKHIAAIEGDISGTLPSVYGQIAPSPLTPRQQALIGLFDGLTDSQQTELLRSAEEKKLKNDEILEELLTKRRKSA
ncbi:MAG: helix-turn-helix domain-containing protein [Rectinemataceae bacterium]|nr:helix-turn-helix domain-containing protein [Rectinemataceae bacterium]